MDISEYIRSEISSHMRKHRILASKSDIDEIQKSALKGNCAFQIIYSDIEETDFDYSLYSFIKLDYAKIVFKPETEKTSAAYSYDGGKRFQWFEAETLLLDPSIIREIKLSKIIN